MPSVKLTEIVPKWLYELGRDERRISGALWQVIDAGTDKANASELPSGVVLAEGALGNRLDRRPLTRPPWIQ